MKLAQLVTFAASLEMQTPDGNHVPVRGRKFDDFKFWTFIVLDKRRGKASRTYQELEDLAVQMFNDDDELKSNNIEFTKDSWKSHFMEYACYCNTKVLGGGVAPGGEDANDELCNTLYKCYKCINIDYDHTGTYAAEEMVYTAHYDPSEKEIQCTNNHHNHNEECPHNICQCDRLFIQGLLQNYKDCVSKVKTYNHSKH